MLFASPPPLAAAVTGILGHNNSDAFLRAFETARDEAFYIFLQASSVNSLADVSFLSTYYHRDISALFEALPHNANPQIVSISIIETARIMLRIIYGNMNAPWRQMYSTRSLSTVLLLAEMHRHMMGLGNYLGPTGRPAYNQSAVAFTLLTFAYLPAVYWENQNYEFSQNSWYYFWKIVGSCLGLDDRLILDTHNQDAQLWSLFFTNGECRGILAPPVNPLNIEHMRIAPALMNGYNVEPELTLSEWVPSFIMQQLKNTPRWFRYLTQ